MLSGFCPASLLPLEIRALNCEKLSRPDLETNFDFKSRNGDNIAVASRLWPSKPKTPSANVEATSDLRKPLQVSSFIVYRTDGILLSKCFFPIV